VMAKSLVRNRAAVTKLYQLKSQLQAVSLRMAELKSTQAMTEAMKGTTKAMAAMNRRMNLPAIGKIMREFERQNARMDQTSEMMGDAVDGAFEGHDEESESDAVVDQVLAEIGLDANMAMVAAPSKMAAPAAAKEAEPQAVGGGVDDDLMARFEALKKP
jgi:charged multivesicular body protein 2A